jgi:signal transduction histidine kinase
VVSVFDSRGVIVARTHAAETFVGRTGAPALVQRMTEVGEDVVETSTLEGIAVSAIFSRSAVSGWTVAIGIPAQTFATELRQRFVLLAIAVAVLLAGGIALALLLGERIARSIRALTAPARPPANLSPFPRPLREAAEVAAAIGTAADLIARRTMELEASNKELEELSYAISHDLTTPLRAIAGFSQIIAEEHGSQIDAEGLRLLDRVRKNTVRMGRLIDSLTGYISIMRRSLVAETVNVSQLVNEVFEELRAAAPERALRLQADGLPPARGDRAMLRWVLEIILSNSIKFIPPSSAGVIVVTGEISGAETVYHVSDNGVGFDMRYADKLFEYSKSFAAGVRRRRHRAGDREAHRRPPRRPGVGRGQGRRGSDDPFRPAAVSLGAPEAGRLNGTRGKYFRTAHGAPDTHVIVRLH